MFGTVSALVTTQRVEQHTIYDFDADTTTQTAVDEHIHGEVIHGLTARLREALAGSFRVAVFGANDDLVLNPTPVVGVAATGVTLRLVLTTGVVGLLSSISSMTAGEWVSVKNQ